VRHEKETKKELVLFEILMLTGYGYVMCCDAGCLYLFNFRHKLLDKVKGHEGWCVALNGDSYSNRFVSGGKDGKIVLWKIDDGQILEIANIAL
jgi:WD40 repeat protein